MASNNPPRAPGMALVKWLRFEQRLGSGVSTSAAHVLAIIAGYVSTQGEAWPSVPTLALDTGLSERTVQRALADILSHPRAPLRRTLGDGHEPAHYTTTPVLSAVLERRGVYARLEPAPDPIPKAPGAEADRPASGAAHPAGEAVGVTSMSPLNPEDVTPMSPLEPAGVTPMSPLELEDVTSMSPLKPGGVTPMSPRRAGGVTPVTPRGDTGDAHIRLKGPLKGPIRETTAVAAAAVARSEPERQQQQQRARDLAEAHTLVAGMIETRARRIKLGAGQDLAGKPLAPLSAPDVVAEASAFAPEPGRRRVVRTAALERMSPAYLARTLLELRAARAREDEAWRAESEAHSLHATTGAGAGADLDEPAEGAEGAEGAEAASPARNAWDLIAVALQPRVDPYTWATWVRPLDGIKLRGGRLLVAGPNEHCALWAKRHAEDIAAAAGDAGLTCVVEVVARQALHARLRLEAADDDRDDRGPPARPLAGTGRRSA